MYNVLLGRGVYEGPGCRHTAGVHGIISSHYTPSPALLLYLELLVAATGPVDIPDLRSHIASACNIRNGSYS